MAQKSLRVKSDNNALSEFNTLSEADHAIKHIGNLQLKIVEAQNRAKQKIDDAKSDLAETAKQLQAEINQLTKSLEAFATAQRRSLFTKRQSIKLSFGILGWRWSSTISITKATLDKIKEYFGKKANSYIHTKETPDKEALAKLTDEDLANVAARRKRREVFFVEPALPKAVDYE